MSKDIPIPQTYHDVLSSPEKEQWMEAMVQEMTDQERNGTWELVPRTSGMNPIKSRWVYTKKFKPDGSLERFKARLVAKGFSQKPGLDYKETFSPVVRYDTVRVLLSLAVQRNIDFCQFDIRTAFLNGDLEESIYMASSRLQDHGIGN